jgi:hypothetical protein
MLNSIKILIISKHNILWVPNHPMGMCHNESQNCQTNNKIGYNFFFVYYVFLLLFFKLSTGRVVFFVEQILLDINLTYIQEYSMDFIGYMSARIFSILKQNIYNLSFYKSYFVFSVITDNYLFVLKIF